MQRSWIVLLIAAVVAACTGESDSKAPSGQPLAYQRPATSAPPHVAWLSRRLPASTVAYLRIPNPWENLTRPGGHVLDGAQADEQHARIADEIAVGLSAQLQAAAPGPSALPRYLLLEQRLPVIELASLAPAEGTNVPDVVMGITIPARSPEAFVGWLEQLAGSLEMVSLLSPPDEQGIATLMAGPMPIYVHHQSDTGRVLALSGFGATIARARELATATGEFLTVLPEFERSIDVAGRGLALWIDPASLWPLASPALEPEQAALLELMGIPQARSLWLGSAARNGRGEWRMHLTMPEVGFRRYLTRVERSSPVHVSGDASLAARIALPSGDELEVLLDFTLSQTVDGTAVRGEIKKFRDQFAEKVGFRIVDLFDALGPDLVTVNDSAGLWSAVAIRDRAAWQRLLQGIEAKTGTSPQPVKRGDLTIHHWALPGLLSMAAEEEDAREEPALAYLKRLRNHLFWIEEGDYLVMASAPQVLIDRQRAAGVPLTEYLDRGLGLDWSGAVFAGAMASRNLPRDVYHTYIQLLMGAADLVEVEIDPVALPTAAELDLPPMGRYGIQLDSTPSAIDLVLSFEHSPADALVGGNAMTATAVVGILAAIAIPAYEDYTQRSRIAEAIASVAGAKLAVSEFYLVEGRFPGDLGEAGLETPWFSPFVSDLMLEGDKLVLTLTGVGAAEGTQLSIRMLPRENAVDFRCTAEGTTAPSHLLPASCREEVLQSQ